MTFASDSPANDAVFQQNRNDMLGKINELRALEARPVALSDRRKAHMRARGQLTPRERLARLLDPGLPFLQLHSLAGYLVDSDDPDVSVPGSNMIAGIGFVSGVRSVVWVDDSGIKAGAIGPMTAQVALSVQDIALKQKLPLIHLVESAGANLMEYKVEHWAYGGMIFRNLAQLSAAGIPTVAVLHGASTAGGAYMPGLSDYVIGVKRNGLAALAGAALVQAATGEQADERALGGAEMHASVSGLVEYLAEDDAHAIDMARDVVQALDWNRTPTPERRQGEEAPVKATDELAGVVPTDYRTSYDVREVLLRLVDGGSLIEFKPDYDAATVCTKAKINGISVGMIGNNGPIDPAGATKAAQFIQLCGQADMPLVFLNNTTGFMVGTEVEQAGMIKHGSKLLQAVSNVDVPRIAFYIGASFGAGNYGMSGFSLSPDFLFAWPNAVTGVMGGEQAAQTMDMVARARAKRQGSDADDAALARQGAALRAHFDRQHTAFYTSGRCLDHGVIDPRDTRKVLTFCLETCREARLRTLKPNSYGVSRF